MTRDVDWLRKLAEAYFNPELHINLPLDDGYPVYPDQDRETALISQVLRLPHDEPEECWNFIVAACQLPLSSEQLGLLGAGIFEDLMDAHGEHFIERVETTASQSPAVQSVVDAVWTMSMKPHVAKRIEQIKKK